MRQPRSRNKRSAQSWSSVMVYYHTWVDSTYYREPLDAVSGVKLSRECRVSFGDPAVEIPFADILLAIMGYRQPQQAFLLYRVLWCSHVGSRMQVLANGGVVFSVIIVFVVYTPKQTVYQ